MRLVHTVLFVAYMNVWLSHSQAPVQARGVRRKPQPAAPDLLADCGIAGNSRRWMALIYCRGNGANGMHFMLALLDVIALMVLLVFMTGMSLVPWLMDGSS